MGRARELQKGHDRLQVLVCCLISPSKRSRPHGLDVTYTMRRLCHANLRQLQLAGVAERAQQGRVAHKKHQQARGHALHERARYGRHRRARRRAELVQVLRPAAMCACPVRRCPGNARQEGLQKASVRKKRALYCVSVGAKPRVRLSRASPMHGLLDSPYTVVTVLQTLLMTCTLG